MTDIELRLTLANVNSEIAEVKRLTMENNDHAKHTNGLVAEHADAIVNIQLDIAKEKTKRTVGMTVAGIFMGAVILPIMAVTLARVYNPTLTPEQAEEIRIAAQQGIDAEFAHFEINPTNN